MEIRTDFPGMPLPHNLLDPLSTAGTFLGTRLRRAPIAVKAAGVFASCVRPDCRSDRRRRRRKKMKTQESRRWDSLHVKHERISPLVGMTKSRRPFRTHHRPAMPRVTRARPVRCLVRHRKYSPGRSGQTSRYRLAAAHIVSRLKMRK